MTDKPNYNDGNWHGWNGGECPVHPETVVDVRYLTDKPPLAARLGGEWIWSHTGNIGDIIAFRVIKEHREPREWWAFCGHLYTTEADADEFRAKLIEKHPANRYETMPIIRVREVLP